MKLRLFTVLSSGASAIVLSSAGHAAYIGLSAESSNSFFDNHPNAEIRTAWLAGPNRLYDIWRLYANFNSNTPADRVNTVAGIPGSPLSVFIFGGTFHNYVDFHGYHYHLPGPAPVERAWDTYVTIGNAINGGATLLSPGFGVQTNNLGGNTSSIGPATNVAWTITPNDAQGQAVSSAPGQSPAPAGTFRVLLAQFVVSQGTHTVSGNLLININGENLANQSFKSHVVPIPGAAVIVCLAGVATSRRRRN